MSISILKFTIENKKIFLCTETVHKEKTTHKLQEGIHLFVELCRARCYLIKN